MGAKLGDEGDGGYIADINVTPLVDITLVLLIVFMVATPVIMNQAVRVRLPKVAHAQAAMPTTVSVTLKKDGTLFFNGEKTSLVNLRRLLKERLAKERRRQGRDDVKLQAIIAADREVSHGDVMHLVDVVKDCGVTEFAFNIDKVDKVPSP